MERQIVTRTGCVVYISSGTIKLPLPCTTRHIDFADLQWGDELSSASIEYFCTIVSRNSTSTASNLFSALLRYSAHCRNERMEPATLPSLSSFKASLAADGNEQYVRYVRDWYVWSSEQSTWPTFSEDIVAVLDGWKIKTPEPYLAVRSGDPNNGPLHPLEDSVVKNAINDSGLDERLICNLTGSQIRALVALIRSTGIRPTQAAYLKQSDLRIWDRDNQEFAILMVPRLKTGKQPRSELRKIRLARPTLSHLKRAIRDIPADTISDPWLFTRQVPDAVQLQQGWIEEAWRGKSFDQAFVSWARKLSLRSPITDAIIRPTPRRLRYTYATSLAPKMSPAELASLLDHQDERSIAHYYTYAPDFIDRFATVDAATKWGSVAKTFLGMVEVEGDQAENPILSPPEMLSEMLDIVGLGRCGSQTLCKLFPPMSCYLCPRFRPDPDADHSGFLEALIKWRSSRPESVDRLRDPLQDQYDRLIEAIGHLLSVLRVFFWLRDLRESGGAPPTCEQIANATGLSLNFIETDRSITSLLRSWPEPTRGQRKIAQRRAKS